MITAFASLVLCMQLTNISQVQPPAILASISGVVLGSGADIPIAGARVTLTIDDPRVTEISDLFPSLRPTVAPTASVTSDDKGQFLIKDVSPGSYHLHGDANGYFQVSNSSSDSHTDGDTVTVLPGALVSNITIRLAPTGSVQGTILDSSGRPAVGLNVQLVRPMYTALGQRSLQISGTAKTDDRGNYRMFWVKPGRYYVQTDDGGLFPQGPVVIRAPYATSYYPGVLQVEEARPIEVLAGGETSDVDFRVSEQRLYKIRGRVLAPQTSSTPTSVTVFVTSFTATGGNRARAARYNSADGSFESSDNQPGKYIVTAESSGSSPGLDISKAPATLVISPASGLAAATLASNTVEVYNSDVEGIILAPVIPAAVEVRVGIEPGAKDKSLDLRALRIELLSVPGRRNLVQSKPDGTLWLNNFLPGQYRLRVTEIPPGLYLKEARFDQDDVLTKPMEFSGAASSSLQIVLGSDGGAIEGLLVDDTGKPCPHTDIIVVPDQYRERVDLYKAATTDEGGRFTIRDVQPGNYRVFSWRGFDQYEYFDSDLVRRMEPYGTRASVSEMGKATVEVRLTLKSAFAQ